MKLALPWWAYDVKLEQREEGAFVRFRVRRAYLAWLWLRTVGALVVSILSRKVLGR